MLTAFTEKHGDTYILRTEASQPKLRIILISLLAQGSSLLGREIPEGAGY